MVMALRNTFRYALRFIFVWFVNALAILFTTWLIPGFSYELPQITNPLITAVAAAFIMGIVNFVIRPIILLLAIPLGGVAVFLFGFFANTIALMITANLLPTFKIDTWGWAFLGSLVFSAINLVLTNILTIQDENSFYQNLIERLARRRMYRVDDPPGRGLVMLEIDGLSFHHMKKAIAEGWMPNVKRMIDEDGYILSRVDCGLPSQTSACQSGIMFGDNYDIPAFRWFDKDQNKLMVSSTDAYEINARYAKGNGLMRAGTSINNMMNGDAQNSLLTLADLRSGSREEKKLRATDISLLMLDPFFLTRTIIQLLWDALVEIFQGFRQSIRNVQPRMNRLHKAFPLLRAATTIFMRDFAASLAKIEIIRGSPSIYITYPGYDEVAHHAGPWTKDAFGTLRQYDEVIGSIRKTIQDKSPRPYELVILSDHGQSTGATFLQRYGYDLKEFIIQQMPAGARAIQVSGGDDGTPSMGALAVELENMQETGVNGRIGNSMTKGAANLLKIGAGSVETEETQTEPTNVTVCGSGNLAQVYFDLFPRRITLNELNSAYPGMVESVVAHEGVGFVVAYDDDFTPVVLGKGGQRNLYTGSVTGQDPLTSYGDIALRVDQVRRVADFPHSGDLMVISTVYPDGSVAAMEELIGNHGGLGGEQTDAFLFHSMDMEVTNTKNSIDVFNILDAQRGKSGWPIVPQKPPNEHIDAWAFSTLFKGIRQVKNWVILALGVLQLHRHAYRQIAREEVMTGPALLLGILGTLSYSSIVIPNATPLILLFQVLSWFIMVLIMYFAGRLLRGNATFTSVFRVVGFAQGIYLLDLFCLIPSIAPIVRFFVSLLVFIAIWTGVAVAHELRGWRSLVFPIVYLLTAATSLLIIYSIRSGLSLAVKTLFVEFGILPPP
jgi:uncharacterized membrane protein YvlD (DUF360 family)